MFNLLGLVGGGLGIVKSLVTGYYDKARNEMMFSYAKASMENELTKTVVNSWKYSWKDEFILVLVSYPYIAAYIPWLREHAVHSMEVIQSYPSWYTTLFVTIAMAIYGVRSVAPTVVNRIGAARAAAQAASKPTSKSTRKRKYR